MSDSDPFTDLESLFDKLTDPTGMGAVPLDVLDTGGAFEVRTDLPGFDPDDIEVQLTDGQTLRIDAERDLTSEGDFVTREREHESVSRSVRLPEPVDDETPEASYEDGVLTVVLPKRTGEEGTSIPVE